MATISIPNRTYQTGVASIAEAPVLAGSSTLKATLNVTQWTNPASVLTMIMEMSEDNGATWVGGGAFTAQCDADGTFRRKGVILTEIGATFQWPPTVNRLRGTITIAGASIRTSGTVEVT